MQLKNYHKHISDTARIMSAKVRAWNYPALSRFSERLKPALLSLFLAILFSAETFAADLQQSVTLAGNNMELKQIFASIKTQTGYSFVYNKDIVNDEAIVNLASSSGSVEEILASSLKSFGLTYSIKNGIIVVTKQGVATNGPIKISGQVLDTAGVPMQGVSVTIVGTRISTITNSGGFFNIIAQVGKKLHFSFLGYDSKMVAVTENAQSLKIVLEGASTQLAGVTVIATGYQTLTPKDRTTGSFGVVSEKKLNKKLNTDVLSRMEGSVAGVVKKGTESIIRGVTSLSGNYTPLYVVNGIPYEGRIENINPNDVENVTVLKDAAAASIYGARAGNGVIVITTKKGNAGNTQISYTSNVTISPIQGLKYLNWVNSSELVDLQKTLFNISPSTEQDPRRSENEIISLLRKHKAGTITDAELNTQLDKYRKTDNAKALKDEFLQSNVSHGHYLTISGGTEANTYMANLGYASSRQDIKGWGNSQIRLGVNDQMRFFKWLTANLSVDALYDRSNSQSGFAPMGYYSSGPSYRSLTDAKGKPIAWPESGKSEAEINRLKNIGLMDETFFPANEIGKITANYKKAYYRIQGGLNFKIWEDVLNLDVKYQMETSHAVSTTLYDKDSWHVKNMINNAAVLIKEKPPKDTTQIKEIFFNVPTGGQISVYDKMENAQTLRAQLNYNNTFDYIHRLTAIGGVEGRAIRTEDKSLRRMGYDPTLLIYKLTNPIALKEVKNTQALDGLFKYDYYSDNYFLQSEQRFLSFYGNASYTYNTKYSLTGSIRVDQSNLFGTDPKYRYKPLWSIGLSWAAKQETFLIDARWIDRLNLRITYGINGNVAMAGGKDLIMSAPFLNDWTKEFATKITTPPNPRLRWEKTATTNIGIDFAFLNNRINGAIDLYDKNTSDLLGTRFADPTLGWNSININYASMRNRGVELNLSSLNFSQKGFEWITDFTFSYNKNEITEIQNPQHEEATQYMANPMNVAGKPMYSLYSAKYAGLDKNGMPLVYDKNGKKQNMVNSVDDLVYSGSTIPPFAASLNNQLGYKGLNFSFLFVYYGGHVFRDVAATWLNNMVSANAGIDKSTLNFWRQPGDENKPGIAPAYHSGLQGDTKGLKYLWYGADIHTKRADYIKLRNITLSYDLPWKSIQKAKLKGMNIGLQIDNPQFLSWFANGSGIDTEYPVTSQDGGGMRSFPARTVYTIKLSANF